MDTSKPKKALRGLFSRTEPEQPVAEKIETKTITPQHITIEEKPLLVENVQNKNTEVLEDYQLNTKPLNETPHSKDAEFTVTKIQYNFDRLKQERNKWDKNEYISLLHRIDNAQTEAFFLKGKLIGEIKERFYEGNRVGWKNFCDENLNMNYTTANQYIRVADEFETYSQQRTDFGFEHFKALLPVPSQERNKIIEALPSSVSVKSLRNIVSNSLAKEKNDSKQNINKTNIKHISDNLEKVKIQLENLNVQSLEQSDKWSLLGAFQNLSEEMARLSEVLSKPSEPRYSSKHVGATSALSEDEYAT
ncbi:hypothetical protein [Silvanigrella aquatica]|uniref:DUF3102 domain-containing protein n=1 Tax=Silvanigrella aquatica TaxID=1915309 RepID=A0A1L4CXJ3_9BACT|nr:hypothetical protein [Silvanigrella aquatica]APJ02665.1 hypothetical protein AXG55_01445 [Silvanigrella aquatica]